MLTPLLSLPVPRAGEAETAEQGRARAIVEGCLRRSFGFKLRLLEESERWPALAIGIQDFGGTGVFVGAAGVGLHSGLPAGGVVPGV